MLDIVLKIKCTHACMYVCGCEHTPQEKHLGRVVAHFLGSDSQQGLAGHELDFGHASVVLLGLKSVVMSQDFVV